jgi:N(2)-fixation sustaining protein CowN
MHAKISNKSTVFWVLLLLELSANLGKLSIGLTIEDAMIPPSSDRYVSFQGIDCDRKARQLMAYIKQYLEKPPHPSPWVDYFHTKLANQRTLEQDDLYFVGSQINSIHALFEEYRNDEALELLEQVEEDCC